MRLAILLLFLIGFYPVKAHFSISDGREDVADNRNHTIQILEEPEITIDVPTKTYGDPEFELEISSNSEGAFSFSILERQQKLRQKD